MCLSGGGLPALPSGATFLMRTLRAANRFTAGTRYRGGAGELPAEPLSGEVGCQVERGRVAGAERG
ncbi:hypothetical protein SUDANB132_00445 [Streptomyces sp. enrichment culture]